jgi:hypothetical protein
MKINQIISEAPAAPAAAAQSATQPQTTPQQTFGQKVGQSVNNFLYKKSQPGKIDYRSKIGGVLSKIGSGAGVKDYNKPSVDSEKFNDFLALLSRDLPDYEQNDIEKNIKNILDKGSDAVSKQKVLVYIKKFFKANAGVTLSDFNTQFRSVLDKMNIKPTEITVPQQSAKPTTAATGTTSASTILSPSGKPFPKTA